VNHVPIHMIMIVLDFDQIPLLTSILDGQSR